MGGSNGKKAAAAVLESVQEIGAEGLKQASAAIEDADLSEKLDKFLDIVESNAGTFAAAARKLASDAAREGAAAAGAAAEAAGGAVSDAAGSGLEAAGDVLESIGEQIVKPTMKYGRGVRHGLVIGAAIAILYTPWPGKMVRDKIKAFGREALDIIEAMREGASEGSA